MKDELLRFTAVRRMVGLSRSTIWRLEKEGLFPRRRQISPHLVGWVNSEVQDWIANRKPVVAPKGGSR